MKGKRLLGILLSFALVIGMLPVLGLSMPAHAETGGIPYIGSDGLQHYADATAISSSGVFDGEWYYVSEDTDIGAIDFTNSDGVNLILADDTTLTVTGGEYESGVWADQSLTIYGQGSGTGKLVTYGYYGIWGTVTINGGSVEATGVENREGILADNVTINGGTVTARGITGIASDSVTINGGNVIAEGKYNGISTNNGTVSINGGTVTASGGTYGIEKSTVLIDNGMLFKAGSSKDDTRIVDINNPYNGEKWAKIGKEVTRNVVFKVVNGKWNDNSTPDKAETLRGFMDETLKLTGSQIPAVGNKPSDGYKAGAWDVTPSTEAAITDDVTYTYTYAKEDKPTPPTPSGGGDKTSGSTDISVGSVHNVNRSKYLVKSATAVYLKKAANGKSYIVPATVKIEGKTFQVAGIQKNAFKGTKVKTVTVKSKKLTKKSVRGSLKGSKIKTIKVKVGKKKVNKQYVKKYKKIFTKKNAGRKVVVK